MLVLDRCVGLVSCPLGNGHQTAADTVPHAVGVVVVVGVVSVASIAVILRSGSCVAEVVAILIF